jgi:hypothetical protein
MSERAASITAADLDAITDLDLAFGTTRHLPSWEEIPEEFKTSSNAYVRVVSAIFNGDQMPDMEIQLAPGVQAALLQRFIRAHLISFEPKHEHKIAGVAYLLSQLCTLGEDAKETHAAS